MMYIYSPKKALAIWKYTSKDKASTIVVIMGLAITAGSKCILSANIGRIAPIILASITVRNRAIHTILAKRIDILSNTNSFMKLQIAKVSPQIIPTENSFAKTFILSLNFTSFIFLIF